MRASPQVLINAHRDRYALVTPFASGSQPVCRLVITNRGTLASDHFLFADDPSRSGFRCQSWWLSHSLVLRPIAIFEVKGKISVDTAPGRFIIILIR